MSLFTGSCVAICTPFSKDGVDFEAYAEQIEYQIANGTDVILCTGTTGEPSTMSHDEKMAVIEFTIKTVAGRVPVMAGTGGNNTASVIADSIQAQSLGADMLLVVTPYYNKCTQKGLIEHFYAVADSVDIPIVVYNVPSRTGVNVLPKTLAELAKHKNIRGLKEASGNIGQMVEICRLVGDTMDIYSGDDGVVVPLMSIGGKGVVSVAANIIPQQMHDMCQKMLDGDVAGAAKMQLEMNPLIDALFCEVNPIPVKTALNLLGRKGGLLRLPLSTMVESNLEILKKALSDYGLM
ncbi:MAG: 4-hydroxy-tetrahydrodipicolinate synthase [Christensenellales bacterium]